MFNQNVCASIERNGHSDESFVLLSKYVRIVYAYMRVKHDWMG